MANNDLTPEQDLLVRRFYKEIAIHLEQMLPSTPVSGRTTRRTCLDLLNYDIIGSGAYITKGTQVSIEYGSKDYSAYPDEWDADLRRALEATGQTTEAPVHETGNDTDTSQTRPSESTKSTEVRKTLLRKDLSELARRREKAYADLYDIERFSDEGGSTLRDPSRKDK